MVVDVRTPNFAYIMHCPVNIELVGVGTINLPTKPGLKQHAPLGDSLFF